METVDVGFEGGDVYCAPVGCTHGGSGTGGLSFGTGERYGTDSSWGENSCFSRTWFQIFLRFEPSFLA